VDLRDGQEPVLALVVVDRVSADADRQSHRPSASVVVPLSSAMAVLKS
jgi:hypothetical protein